MPIQKVLVAETNASARAAACAALGQGEGWQVVIAAEPAEVQGLVESHRPDVLLLDAGLLTTLGADFAARLRARKATSRVVIVLAAEGADPAPPGAAGVVRKPFNSQTLVPEVRSLFEVGRFHQQLARLGDIGGADFVREMIDLFLEHSPPRLAAARAGLEAGNLSAVAQAVHPLKSSAGNLGADAVQGLAERIEQMATEGTGGPLPNLLCQLEQVYVEVKTRLEAARGTCS